MSSYLKKKTQLQLPVFLAKHNILKQVAYTTTTFIDLGRSASIPPLYLLVTRDPVAGGFLLSNKDVYISLQPSAPPAVCLGYPLSFFRPLVPSSPEMAVSAMGSIGMNDAEIREAIQGEIDLLEAFDEVVPDVTIH